MLSHSGKLLLVLGSCFLICGLVMLGSCLFSRIGQSKIIENGTKYSAKVCEYVADENLTVNNYKAVNLIVRYFDDGNNVREELIKTRITVTEAGDLNEKVFKHKLSKDVDNLAMLISNVRGLTIDVYVYEGDVAFDINSLRIENLPNEAKLLGEESGEEFVEESVSDENPQVETEVVNEANETEAVDTAILDSAAVAF